MKDIYSRIPIDKTAAVVTGQSGCASDNTLSDEQLRENLVVQWQKLESNLLSFPKKSARRRELGQKMQDLQVRINAIRPKKKAPGVENYFIDCVREVTTKIQFSALMEKAVLRMKKDIDK